MKNDREGVFPSSGHIFAELGLPEPEARLAKAQVGHAIRSRIQEYGLNQTQAADAATSLASSPKPVDGSGQAALVVEDESRQGDPVHLVLLDAAGNVIAKQTTVVGE